MLLVLTGLLRFSDELKRGNGLANCMLGVWRVLLIVLLLLLLPFGCECCWAIEVLIGGGFGLFLCARAGEEPTLLFVLLLLLFDVVVVVVAVAVAVVGDGLVVVVAVEVR